MSDYVTECVTMCLNVTESVVAAPICRHLISIAIRHVLIPQFKSIFRV